MAEIKKTYDPVSVAEDAARREAQAEAKRREANKPNDPKGVAFCGIMMAIFWFFGLGTIGDKNKGWAIFWGILGLLFLPGLIMNSRPKKNEPPD